MVLTDKLTNIAEAIRGKTGGTELLTLDEMATAIASITGAGGADIHIETLITFAQDMTLGQMMNTAQHRLRYKNSMVFLIATGSTSASSGNYVLNNFLIVHNGATIILGLHQWKSGMVAPDQFKSFSGTWEVNPHFRISSDGLLSSSSTSTSTVGGPGTVIQAIEIPINTVTWENWTADGTLWGEK